MKLNAIKTKTMIVSRSRTMLPQSLPLTIGGTVLKESDEESDDKVKAKDLVRYQVKDLVS